MSRTIVAVVVATSIGFAGALFAQQPAPPTSNIKRTMLQKVDVPGTNYETVTAIAEIAPGASSGRHTHPGPETGYVKAGDSYQIPASAVHDVKSSDKGMKVMAVYIVERGKPLASPAP